MMTRNANSTDVVKLNTKNREVKQWVRLFKKTAQKQSTTFFTFPEKIWYTYKRERKAIVATYT